MPIVRTLKNGQWVPCTTIDNLPLATQLSHGLMSSADKVKLDGLVEDESGTDKAIKYRRKGKIVTINVNNDFSSTPIPLVANTFVLAGTLPTKFRPLNESDFFVDNKGGTAQILGRIYTNGAVKLYSNSATNIYTGTITYIT